MIEGKTRIWNSEDTTTHAVVSAAGDWPIIGVNTTTEVFTIDGDYTSVFTAGVQFTVYGSTGNDGTWTVSSSALNGGDTEITVTGDITDATVDGYITSLTGVYTITIATDQTAYFVEDFAFEIVDGANEGWFTTVSSSYSAPNTTIVVNETVITTVAAGVVTMWDYLTLDTFAEAVPAFNNPHRIITDRRGIEHRIANPGATSKKRFISSLTVTILPNDIDRMSSLNKRLNTFFRAYSIDDDTMYRVFTQVTSTDQGGNSYSEKYRYDCYLTNIPGWLYGTRSPFTGADAPQVLVLEFFVKIDGTFTDFDNMDSIVDRTRP